MISSLSEWSSLPSEVLFTELIVGYCDYHFDNTANSMFNGMISFTTVLCSLHTNSQFCFSLISSIILISEPIVFPYKPTGVPLSDSQYWLYHISTIILISVLNWVMIFTILRLNQSVPKIWYWYYHSDINSEFISFPALLGPIHSTTVGGQARIYNQFFRISEW